MNKLKIKMALQKKGRLAEESIKFLKDCGITITFCYKDKLRALANNFPMEIFFLRDDDIPTYIQNRIVDIGIVGKNIVYEQKKIGLIKEKLGFSGCRLSLAIPKETIYKNLKFLSEKRIATSYPNILKNYLEENSICSEIVSLSGSVEIAPDLGIADAICDIVSSGETLFKNNLKEIEQVFASEAVLLCCTKYHQDIDRLVRLFLFRVQAGQNAIKNKYLLFYAPNKILDKIFYLLGPSASKNKAIFPIRNNAEDSYVQVIVEDKNICNTIYNLERNGAKQVIVLPIQNLLYKGMVNAMDEVI